MFVDGAFQTFFIRCEMGAYFYTVSRNLLCWQTAKWNAVEQSWIAQLSMFNFEVHYKPGKENEDTDFLLRNPINCPTEDDEEDGDISLCSIDGSKTQENIDSLESHAKLQVIQNMEEAEENFKLENPMDNLPSYMSEDLTMMQIQDADISKVRDIINLKTRINKNKRSKLPPSTRKLLQQRKRLIFVNNILSCKVCGRMGKTLQYVVLETLTDLLTVTVLIVLQYSDFVISR